MHVHTSTALWYKAEGVVGAQEIVSLEKEDASLLLPHALGGMTWGITGGPVGWRDDHLSRPLEPALRMTALGECSALGCVWHGGVRTLLWGKRGCQGHRGGELLSASPPFAALYLPP